MRAESKRANSETPVGMRVINMEEGEVNKRVSDIVESLGK